MSIEIKWLMNFNINKLFIKCEFDLSNNILNQIISKKIYLFLD